MFVSRFLQKISQFVRTPGAVRGRSLPVSKRVDSLESRLLLTLSDLHVGFSGYPEGMDLEWGVEGKSTFEFPSGGGTAWASYPLPDGEVLTAGFGSGALWLVHFGPDGVPVPGTLGGDGSIEVALPAEEGSYAPTGTRILFQPDGRIVVGGLVVPPDSDGVYAFALWRFNPDGTLDESFSDDGFTTLVVPGDGQITALGLLSDGSIIAGGEYSDEFGDDVFCIAHFFEDGTPDTDFNENAGNLPFSFTNIAIQPDDRILTEGDGFTLMRLNSDGTLDESFDSDGIAENLYSAGGSGWLTSMAVQSDGKIVAGGTALAEGDQVQQMVLMRLNSDGSIDAGFGSSGFVTTPLVQYPTVYGAADLLVEPDGRIVVVSTVQETDNYLNRDAAIYGFLSDGQSDPNFGTLGRQTIDFTSGDDLDEGLSLMQQPNGQIVVTGRTVDNGTSRFAVARFGGSFTVTVGEPLTFSGDFTDTGSATTFTYDWQVSTLPNTTVATGTDSSLTYLTNSLDQHLVEVLVTSNTGETAQARITVQPVLPTVNVAPVNLQVSRSNATITENSDLTLSGSFVDWNLQDSHSLVINWGDGATSTMNLASGVTSFSGLTHRYVDNPSSGTTYSISATVADQSGASSTVNTAVTVVNVAPTAVISGAPASSPEGTVISLTSSSTDPGVTDQAQLTLAWSVTKNGVPYGTPSSAAAYSFVPNDNGTYIVTLMASDKDGASHSTSKTIVVTNVAPAVNAGAAFTVVQGGTALLNGSATDPAGSNDSLTFAWDLNYNGVTFDVDATGPSQIFSPDGLTAGSTRTVALRVTDDDGGSSISTVVATVTVPAASTSITSSLLPLGTAAGGSSSPATNQRTMSSDGRYVVFQSDAPDLVSGDTNNSTDVFLLDRQTGVITLVSIGASGIGNSYSSFPTISADGRYVAFYSNATNLVAGDTNGCADIFRRDLTSNVTVLVSTGASGIGNSSSYSSSISSDGRYVAFQSYATNLVTGDTNGFSDIFRRDLVNNVTVLVSANGNGNSDMPSISADGRYVAFNSYASNLVTGDTNTSADIFRRDLNNNLTVLVSTGPSGIGNSYSSSPSISADGRYVAFQSYATNLAAGDTNGYTDIFRRDLTNNLTVLVSTGPSGIGNALSSSPSISADGRYVAFYSNAANLVTGDTNGYSDVFRRDLTNNVTLLVSTGASGIGNSLSSSPSINADGRYVVFQSSATNLATGDTNGRADVYLRDTLNSGTSLVSTRKPSEPWNLATAYGVYLSSGLASSADGRYSVFTASDPNLAVGSNTTEQVYRRDNWTGTTVLVSTSLSGAGNSSSSLPSISADGRYVAFQSSASNLVTGDTNGIYDIFRRDLTNNVTVLVSTGTSGIGNNSSFSPSISADGKYVAFQSYATNLVTGDTNASPDIFRRDLTNNVTVLVSTGTSGTGNNSSSSPSISADGKYVAFQSYASNLVTGDTNASSDIFRRDLTNNVTVLVSTGTSGIGNGSSSSPSISADGRYVAFQSSASNLVTGDTNGVYDIFRRDLTNNVTVLVSTGASGIGNNSSSSPSVSADGRYVAFVSDASNLTAVDTPGSDVFRRDLLAATTTLVSSGGISWGGYPAAGSATSAAVAISADGRYVQFAGYNSPYNRYSQAFQWWSGVPAISLNVANDVVLQNLVSAVNALPAQLVPVTITLNLATGTYSDIVASPKSGITLVIRQASGAEAVIVGHSPALQILSGSVIVEGVTLTTDTDSPTVIVTGGDLTLRDTTIQESSGGDQPAIQTAADSRIDLGTADSPGGNTISIRGTGDLLESGSQGLVTALGNLFDVDGNELTSGTEIQQQMVNASGSDGSGLVTFIPGVVYVQSDLQTTIDAVPAGFTLQIAEGAWSNVVVGDKPLTLAFENGPTLALTLLDGTTHLELTGTAQPDALTISSGVAGGDVVAAFSGFPAITFATTGSITASGGDGNDSIISSVANDLTVDGGNGTDSVVTGSGVTYVVDATGSDQVVSGSGTTTIVAELAPSVTADEYPVASDTILNVPVSGVLSNDISSESGAVLTATLLQTTSQGLLEFNADGSFRYTPASGFVGADSFIYQAQAANSSPSTPVTVTIIVLAPPVLTATDSSVAVNAGSPASLTGTAFADPGAGGVTLTSSLGQILVAPDGTWLWQLASTSGLTNQDVVITATDGLGGRSLLTFSLLVNQAPVVTGPLNNLTVTQGAASQSISLTSVFTDPDDTTLNYAVISSDASIISASISGNNLLLTFSATSVGTASITVTASDPGGLSASATFTGTVSPANQTGVFLNDGVLTIRGTRNQDEIKVKKQGASYVVKTNFGSGAYTFALNAVSSILVESFDGDDNVEIANSVSVPAVIDGGSGNDELRGGAGRNHIFGGPGNDALYGGNDADELDGGAGNDQIDGGNGDDVLIGGAGNDDLVGRAGDDILLGGDGNDQLDGGSGTDVLSGGAGNDELEGGGQRDVIIGGLGRDSLKADGSDDILAANRVRFEDDLVGLRCVLAEWTSNRSYAARVANLRGTGTGTRSNAGYFLNATTVEEDLAIDTLMGSGGLDWFLGTSGIDIFRDRRSDELLNW